MTTIYLISSFSLSWYLKVCSGDREKKHCSTVHFSMPSTFETSWRIDWKQKFRRTNVASNVSRRCFTWERNFPVASLALVHGATAFLTLFNMHASLEERLACLKATRRAKKKTRDVVLHIIARSQGRKLFPPLFEGLSENFVAIKVKENSSTSCCDCEGLMHLYY